MGFTHRLPGVLNWGGEVLQPLAILNDRFVSLRTEESVRAGKNAAYARHVPMIGGSVGPALRILIVGDEAVLAANLKAYLGRNALGVRIATDADAAAQLFQSFAPDLAVLDHAGPGIDPLRAHEKLSGALAKPARFLLITAEPEAIAARASRQGVQHILGEPISLAELQNAANACMMDRPGNAD